MNVVQGFIDRKQNIWRAEQIVEEVKRDYDLKVSNAFVGKVLRQVYGMRYKKVQRVAFLGNSNRNLYLRQKCAQKMLSLLNEGKVIVNIDESWLSESDFRRKKWRLRG